MTQLDLDQIDTVIAAATPGPWHLTDADTIVAPLTTDEIADVWEPTQASRNGEFIEAARTAMPAMAAEIRRLRAELATARVQAILDLAAKAEPQPPQVSFFGDHGHEVGAWIRKQAEYEQQRAAANACPGFEKEYQGVSDAKRRLANCKHCGQQRTAHTALPVAEETHVVADDSDDPEHIDDCPGCAAATGGTKC